MVRRGPLKGEEKPWKHLLEVARGADSDPWRNRLRDAIASGNSATLSQLADSDRVTDLPPSTLLLLGQTLYASDLPDRAVALLRQAQGRYRGDFWINNFLAHSLQRLKPVPWDEVIRFGTAALAVRPQSPGAHYNLGRALRNKAAEGDVTGQTLASSWSMGRAPRYKGDVSEAIAAYKRAIELKGDYAQAHQGLADVLLR
jgi:tetratricopeptide (TPR) repeat protein